MAARRKGKGGRPRRAGGPSPPPPRPLPAPRRPLAPACLRRQVVLPAPDHKGAGDQVLAAGGGLADLRWEEAGGGGRVAPWRCGRLTRGRGFCQALLCQVLLLPHPCQGSPPLRPHHTHTHTPHATRPSRITTTRIPHPPPATTTTPPPGLTCSGCTHHALVTILASQAWLRHTHAWPACDSVRGGMGAPGSLLRTMVEEAPCRSACTYASPRLRGAERPGRPAEKAGTIVGRRGRPGRAEARRGGRRAGAGGV